MCFCLCSSCYCCCAGSCLELEGASTRMPHVILFDIEWLQSTLKKVNISLCLFFVIFWLLIHAVAHSPWLQLLLIFGQLYISCNLFRYSCCQFRYSCCCWFFGYWSMLELTLKFSLGYFLLQYANLDIHVVCSDSSSNGPYAPFN